MSVGVMEDYKRFLTGVRSFFFWPSFLQDKAEKGGIQKEGHYRQWGKVLKKQSLV
jgi:hypothetical protein